MSTKIEISEKLDPDSATDAGPKRGVQPLSASKPAEAQGVADVGGSSTGPAEPATPAMTEDVEVLQSRAAATDPNWELYLRARAELDNYRKRASRERQDAVRFASLGLIERLVPVLDSFDLALAASASGEGSTEALQQGIAMVYGQLKAALTEAGVQEIHTAGQVFDPNLHEAIAQVDSTEVPEGYVLQQVRKGYRFHDRLVRPASVIVARAPSAATV